MGGNLPEEYALQITEKAFHTNAAGILKTTIVTKYWLNKNSNKSQEQQKNPKTQQQNHTQNKDSAIPIFKQVNAYFLSFC